MEDYRHILLATDLSPDSLDLGRRALDLARRYDARLSLVHVVEYAPVDLLMPQPVELADQLMQHSRTALEEIARQLGIPDAALYLEFGSPKTEITRVAREQGVDLIVLGSHGRHGLQLLLGSTANGVLHAAPCDALAIRIKG